MMDDAEARTYKPNVIFVDENNRILESGTDPADVPEGSDLKNPRSPENQG